MGYRECGARIEPLLGPRTFAVSLQNGVDKDDVLRARLGADHVAGGAAYIAATLVFPGAVRHTGNVAKLIFGEFDGARSARVEAFAAACAASGIEAEISPDIERATWEKFVFLVGGSGIDDPHALADGADPLEPAQPRALARRDARNGDGGAGARHRAARRLRQAAPGFRHAPRGFRLVDARRSRRGNRLEVPWLSGAVARMGHELGVPTPVNRVIADALSPLENGRAAKRHPPKHKPQNDFPRCAAGFGAARRERSTLLMITCPFPILADERIALEPLRLDHADEAFALIARDRPYLAQWLSWAESITTLDDVRLIIDATSAHATRAPTSSTSSLPTARWSG